jgi:hypothetical protein
MCQKSKYVGLESTSHERYIYIYIYIYNQFVHQFGGICQCQFVGMWGQQTIEHDDQF